MKRHDECGSNVQRDARCVAVVSQTKTDVATGDPPHAICGHEELHYILISVAEDPVVLLHNRRKNDRHACGAISSLISLLLSIFCCCAFFGCCVQYVI